VSYWRQWLGIILSSVLLAACSGGSATASGGSAPSSGGPQNVALKGLDTLKYDPATVTVKNGSPVHLTLSSTGTLIHDWVVDSLDGKKVSVEAAGGQSASVDFTPAKAGTYQFYCSQPGHREAGMVGTLTVQ
jgi:nitrite reductase (NO-forming)